ncbi:MAG: asparagine synthase (glutamine-hydrolyzing) [Acidobacteria bacterium]|nr:asparagine synthase (glutamine-hydrolyzing) [Acidobacteriota bacterium]
MEDGILRRMTARLAHRGPDGEGYFSSPEVSFGHRRLAIIDVPGGAQPMTTADGRYTIVFNGEIYNFRALRQELEAEGARFRTRSDTEALLEMFARRGGAAALEKFRGMFAFAVWDAEQRALFLARDRLGVKPLYYCVRGGRLLFASEIKALLAHPDVPRRLNAAAVDDFLTYLYVPAPQTIFEGISDLPPAHWLEWKNGSARIERYWDAIPEPGDAPAAQLEEELRAQLDQAVRLRLESDVPLGAFLSGGIDSSSIVALMARASANTVRSFSLGFGVGAEHYTEIEYARRVSRRYNTEHKELEIHPKCAELMPAMVAHFDEPFGNPTALLIYQLAELTRRHVTVALAGDAGDEVFLGYPRYHGVRLRRYLDLFPRAARRAVAALADRISESSDGFHARRRAREFLTTAGDHWQQAYASWVSYFSPTMRRELYTGEFRAAVGDYDSAQVLDEHFARVAHCAPLDQVGYVDLHTFLPYNLLEYGDRMSMAHALELRLPFTDHRLVEFSMRLPAELKLRGRHTKYLLREAVRPLLPAEILERPKLGLNPPLGMWLQRELAPLMDQYLSEETVRRRGWFRPEAVTRLREDFRSGRRDYSLHLWGLLVLEEWARQYA